jgi:hypothetical protein
MAEILELQIDPSQLNHLQARNISVEDFLYELFKDEQQHAMMCSALQEYHRNDGGSPEVDAFKIVNASLNVLELIGRFRTVFKVKYHYTCSDVRNMANDTIDWRFSVDQANASIHLTGEEPWVREGDEF